MKIIKKLSFVLFTILFVTSCEKIEELSNFDFSTDLEKEISIIANEEGQFTQTFTIDLSENTDVEPYLDKIESIKINNANYRIVAYSGPDVVATTIVVESENQVFGPFNHENIQEDFNNATAFVLEGTEKFNVIANKLKSSKQIEVVVSGSTDSLESFSATLKLKFNVTISAQAL